MEHKHHAAIEKQKDEILGLREQLNREKQGTASKNNHDIRMMQDRVSEGMWRECMSWDV